MSAARRATRRLVAEVEYRVGRGRLRWGFCPACNSSPPTTGCPVCRGSYVYGHDLGPVSRQLWADRWALHHGRPYPRPYRWTAGMTKRPPPPP